MFQELIYNVLLFLNKFLCVEIEIETLQCNFKIIGMYNYTI